MKTKRYIKALIIILILCGLTALILYGLQYTAVLQAPQVTPGTVKTPEDTSFTPSEASYSVESMATNLEIPWSIVFPSESRVLVSERTGTIQQFENWQRQEPFYEVSEISTNAEEGLMGMTLDPDYPQEPFIYISYAYPKENELFVKVVRLTDLNGAGTNPVTLLDDIPAARFHAGSRIKFGPDNKLYVTTGDAVNKDLAQDLDSLAGKILRLNKDGSIPNDNPFPNSYVYSYGHRNPQGIDWDPISEDLFSTEHGPSLFDGPAGGDEFNRILPGENYGWPLVSHQKSLPDAIDPLLVYTPAVAPASGMFYSGTQYPELSNAFLFGGLVGEGVYVIYLDQTRTKVSSYEQLDISVGRIREIVQGPDEAIYFTTSNQDGRGEPNSGDDQIFRLIAN